MQAYIVRYSIDEQGTLKLGIKVKFGECSAEERAALATAKADGTEITLNIQDVPAEIESYKASLQNNAA